MSICKSSRRFPSSVSRDIYSMTIDGLPVYFFDMESICDCGTICGYHATKEIGTPGQIRIDYGDDDGTPGLYLHNLGGHIDYYLGCEYGPDGKWNNVASFQGRCLDNFSYAIPYNISGNYESFKCYCDLPNGRFYVRSTVTLLSFMNCSPSRPTTVFTLSPNESPENNIVLTVI